MARKLVVLLCVMLMAVIAAPVIAGQFPDLDAKIKAYKAKEKAAGDYAAKARAEGAKARAESNANDRAEKNFAAGAVVAKAAKDKAVAYQARFARSSALFPLWASL